MSLFRPEVFENKRLQRFGRTVPLYAGHSLPITLVLIFAMAVLLIWMVTGHYARTQVVDGWIIPNGPMARIMPQQPGILAALDVREGQSVRRGQRLGVVELQSANAFTDNPAAQSLGIVARQRAELDEQQKLSSLSSAQDQERLRSTAREMADRLGTMVRQIGLQQERVASAQKSFAVMTEAAREKAVNKIDFENQRRAYLAEKAQLEQFQSDRATLRSQYEETQGQLRQAPVKLQQRIADLRANRIDLEKQQLSIEQDRSIVLTAPFDGVVGVVQARRGQPVGPQMPILQILGAGTSVEAELYAPSRAIGFASIGQEVRLMYDAFPYQQFGTFKGIITEISRTALGPEEVNAPLKLEGPSYRVRIRLDRQAIPAFGGQYAVQPGMTLKANVILDRQSFLDWLLEPINAVRKRL